METAIFLFFVFRKHCLVLLTAIVPALGMAASTTEPAKSTWLARQFDWLLAQRENVADNIELTATSLDRFIARQSFDETIENDSYLRIRLSQQFNEGGDNESEARIKLKVDLPNTKRATRLFFDSDPDDFDSIADKRRTLGDSSSGSRQNREDSVAGISFDTSPDNRWRSDFDVGIKMRTPIDPFVRYQFRYADDLGSLWKGRFKHTFSYFKSESWGTDTELTFYRPIGSDRVMLAITELQFTDPENNWESFQGFKLQHRLNDRDALEYSTGIVGNSQPRTQVTLYWVNMSWRRRLYQDWLYLSTTPEVNFERDNNFSGRFSLRFELEIFFTDER